MGYAGIHLSGIHTAQELEALEQEISVWLKNTGSLEHWSAAWAAATAAPGHVGSNLAIAKPEGHPIDVEVAAVNEPRK